MLENVDLSNYENNDICIDELCYMCIMQNVGLCIPMSSLTIEEIEEYENNESYTYCDISTYLEDTTQENQYFMCIENMRCENIEIHS